MLYQDLKKYIEEGKLDSALSSLNYDDIPAEKKRYLNILNKAYELYGDGDYHLISSPGRTEIGGNHTDHQHGHVLAASLNLDNIICVKKCDEKVAIINDDKFGEVNIDLECLEFVGSEVNTSASLIRGIAHKFKGLGYKTGGFKAVSDSNVLAGSGISSSASFEMMIGEVFNVLYNDGQVDPVTKAIIGQYAENKFFGKPSGLLDQMTISVGGFAAIDFKNPISPDVENYNFNFEDYGYKLILVNTKGSHSDLSGEYAAVPGEIRSVSAIMNKEVLGDVNPEDFFDNIASLRDKVNNDRAILRSFHFFEEDSRAVLEKEAVKNKDIKGLLKLINESGRSSFMYLQNVYPASRPTSQALAIALAMSEKTLKDDGAFRVHGGGFDGTIQAIVPFNKVDEYKKTMMSIFGDDSILLLKVRNFGTKEVI